jgi:hypothetical protein
VQGLKRLEILEITLNSINNDILFLIVSGSKKISLLLVLIPYPHKCPLPPGEDQKVKGGIPHCKYRIAVIAFSSEIGKFVSNLLLQRLLEWCR